MGNVLRNVFRLLTIGLVFAGLSSVANAAVVDAVLSGIEISPINGSYEITINSNKAVPIRTSSSGTNKMYIDLKGITPSKSINTVYKNAANISHVFVRPMGKNVRIILQGDNVASSQVLLNSSKIPMGLLKSENTKKTLVLNKSIDKYRPLLEETEEDFEADAPAQGIIFPAGFEFDLFKIFSVSNMGWMMGLSFMLIFLVKSLRETKELRKKSVNMSFRTPPEELEKRRRELGLQQELAAGVNQSPRRTNAKNIDLQKELSMAHGKFQDSLLRKQGLPPQNAFNQNVGIKQYQDSQTNPLTKVSKKPQQSQSITKNELKDNLEKLKGKINLASKKPEKKDINEAQIKLNNMKFLENMKEIYEKNGRIDLAHSITEQMRQKR